MPHLPQFPEVNDPGLTAPFRHEQTPEQRKATFQAIGVPLPETITGADLAQTPTPNFQTPQPQPIFRAEDIEVPELKLTEPEKEAGDLSKQIQALNEQIIGQSAFRTAQEQELGVGGLRKTQTDLTNQLRSLQAEAKALEITPEFERRATLQPFAEGERGRALRDVAVRSLIVGANLQAAQGNLASALDQVDRAVAQRFDPIKEEIKVKKANLDLILDSPEASLADKRRAQQQKNAQDTRLRQIEIQEREQDAIWKIGLEAAGAGADAITLRKIQQAKTASEATQLAAPFLKKPETGQSEFERAFFREHGRLPTATELREKTTTIPGLTPDLSASRLTAQGLSPAILTTENKLTKGNADAIAAKGVPPSVVELITQAILEGDTLEDIREALAEGQGRDVGFGYLDKYMSTLQEKESGKTKLDKLLEEL